MRAPRERYPHPFSEGWVRVERRRSCTVCAARSPRRARRPRRRWRRRPSRASRNGWRRASVYRGWALVVRATPTTGLEEMRDGPRALAPAAARSSCCRGSARCTGDACLRAGRLEDAIAALDEGCALGARHRRAMVRAGAAAAARARRARGRAARVTRGDGRIRAAADAGGRARAPRLELRAAIALAELGRRRAPPAGAAIARRATRRQVDGTTRYRASAAGSSRCSPRRPSSSTRCSASTSTRRSRSSAGPRRA